VITLRALGALLTYPRSELRDALPEIRAVLSESIVLGPAEKERVTKLIEELHGADPFELEERYVDLFDRGRWISLCLFEHVHGDSRERGQAMVDLKKVYERAGFQLASNELPDYLPAVLEYLSYRTPAEVREMLADCAHILRAIGERLASRRSRYAAVLDALLAAAGQSGLDWSTAPAPPEPIPHVDEDWMDAPAFGAGSQNNQSPERGVTPIHFMPHRGRRTGAPQ